MNCLTALVFIFHLICIIIFYLTLDLIKKKNKISKEKKKLSTKVSTKLPKGRDANMSGWRWKFEQFDTESWNFAHIFQ